MSNSAIVQRPSRRRTRSCVVNLLSEAVSDRPCFRPREGRGHRATLGICCPEIVADICTPKPTFRPALINGGGTRIHQCLHSLLIRLANAKTGPAMPRHRAIRQANPAGVPRATLSSSPTALMESPPPANTSGSTTMGPGAMTTSASCLPPHRNSWHALARRCHATARAQHAARPLRGSIPSLLRDLLTAASPCHDGPSEATDAYTAPGIPA